MPPNLVLGVVHDYAFTQIEPFVASLRRAAPQAALCLFASNMDARFAGVARALGIRLEDPAPYAVLPYHPLLRRMFLYDGFLRRHGEQYGDVLLSDVRDVVFQSDPFAPARPAEVLFAAEDALIGECELNLSWIGGVYGAAVAAELAGNPIVCAGTTLGSLAGIRRYLADMIGEIERVDYHRAGNFDQGMHNYLAWRLRPDYAAVDLARRVVRTLGFTGRDRVQLTEGLIRVDGGASPVVHQWDRHEKLVRFIAQSPQFQLP